MAASARPPYEIAGVFKMSQDVPAPERFAKLVYLDPLPETELFDDLYFIGTSFVGVMILKTSAGLIMIDAMNRAEDLDQIILPKMAEADINPEDIKILIITHGHVDHYGCAKQLQQRYGCRVYMSAIDEKFMNETILSLGDDPTIRQGPGAVPSVDVYITEGDQVQLGDTVIDVFFTPGHTPGGLSFIFPVHDGDEEHLVGLWGGTQIPDDRAAALQYRDSINHFIRRCRERGVDVSVQSHAFADYSLQKGMFHGKIQAVKAAGRKHPMIMGAERFQIFLECIRAAVTGKLELM